MPGDRVASVLLCSQGQAGTGPSVGQWLPPMPALILTPQLSMGNLARDLGGSHTLWAGGLLSAEAQQAELGWPGLEWPWSGGRLYFSLLLASGRSRQIETGESREDILEFGLGLSGSLELDLPLF